MATSILENALILYGDASNGRDLTGATNTVGVDYGAETDDDTSFRGDTRSNKGGLKTAGFNAEGFFDPEHDAALFDAVGISGSVLCAAKGTVIGDRAFALRAVTGSYQPLGGNVGEMASYSLNASARGDLERGHVLFHSESETASGEGATFQAGSAAESLVAILYVFSVSGSTPTLDVTVESDSTNTFDGTSETARLTFDQATDTEMQRKTGTATSDTWWRVTYTIGGTNPDIGFAVILVPTA